MTRKMFKLTTMVVTIALVLTAFSVLATRIRRDEVVACAGNDQEVDVNALVRFDGTCSTGPAPLSYEWYFGDGYTETKAQPTHTYQTEGIYHVTLVVKDVNNVYDLDTVRIAVKNYYPLANVGFNVTKVVDEDEIVEFDAFSSLDWNYDIVSYQWDFGDGTSATGITASNVYEKEGLYYVTLTVADNDGAYDKDVGKVAVNNVVPTAEGIANGEVDDDITVYEDDVIDLDASQSSDTPSDLPLLSYGWDFGDGSKGSGIATAHTYTKTGTYTITLTVKDDNDAFTQDTMAVQVLNAPPVADAGSDQTVDEGDTVFFDSTGSSDTPSDEPLLNYSWSFGEYGTNPTHNWYDDSVNHVEMLVEDDDGAEDRDSIDITVKNVPPVASIDAVYVPVDFTLRASGEKWHNVQLRVTEPNKEVSFAEVLRTPGSPNDQSVTAEDVHMNIAENVDATVYYTPMDDPVNGQPNGATPVWLTLTFEDGSSITLHRTFNVQKPEEWTWVHDMNRFVGGYPIHFKSSVYDPGTDDIWTRWSFGDGSPLTPVSYVSNGAHPMRIAEHVVHSYTYGQFRVNFEANDDDGGIGAMSVTITNTNRLTATNVAPKASSTGGITVLEDEQLTLFGVGEDTGSDEGTLRYTWDFGDGKVANDPIVTHSYAKAGEYYPTLVIADDSGDVGITSELVVVRNVVPAAVADDETAIGACTKTVDYRPSFAVVGGSGGDEEAVRSIELRKVNPAAVAGANRVIVDEDEVISFDAYDSSDTPSDLPILQYAWDFGDGSKGFGIELTHVYSKKGLYQVVLKATDDNGAWSTSEMTFEVRNVAPYQGEIIAGDIVDEDRLIFFAETVTDTPSDVPLLEYSWDFDDGSAGTGRSPTHAFVMPKGHRHYYIVRLTVTDDDGTQTESTKRITINDVDPQAYGGISKSFYGPQMNVAFYGRGFDTPSDQSTLTLSWDFGDGSGKSGDSPDHKYRTNRSRTYTASLTVTDEHGSSDVFSITVNIKVDSDGDQLLDADELDGGTNPFDYDTDDDWLIDNNELDPPSGRPETDPRKADKDKDGCTDWEEIWPGEDGYTTDPANPDTDHDGLADCNEVYSKSFKTIFRKAISDASMAPDRGYGIAEVPLDYVRHYARESSIIQAEARIGITHKDTSELRIEVRDEDRNVVLLDRSGSGVNLFATYDLMSLGFSPSDFSRFQTWTLKVDDQVPLAAIDTFPYFIPIAGYVEYFEILFVMRTDPTDSDTDNDGLKDSEEVTLGNDGWITDPWNKDTDGDLLRDSLESQGWMRTTQNIFYPSAGGFKTDPTRMDTDRDFVNDALDWDPLHNMMIQIDFGDFTPLDEDGPGEGTATEVFLGVSVGIYEYDEGRMIWTDRQTVEYNDIKYLDRQYTFEVDDSKRSHIVIIVAYDFDDYSDDDILDFMPGWPNGYRDNYDIIQGTPDVASDDQNCSRFSGEDNYDPDLVDASLAFCISTVRPPRTNTILLNSTDSESLYRTADGQFRFVGEQDFYLFLLYVTLPSSNSLFTEGNNTIIVPRAVFMNSGLNTTLKMYNRDNTILDQTPYLKYLNFSTYNTKTHTPVRSIAGVITNDWLLFGPWADNILWLLTHDLNNKTKTIAESRVVTDQLVTLNLDPYVLRLIPFQRIEFDATGEDPETFFEGLVETLSEIIIDIFSFMVRLVKVIAKIGLFFIGLVVELIEAIVDAIVFIAKIILDVIQAVVVFIVETLVKVLRFVGNVVMSALKAIGGPVFEFLGRAFKGAMDAIGDALAWVAKDFVPGVFKIVKGALDVGAHVVHIVGGFATCVGDLTVGEASKGNCRAILDALSKLGRNFVEIMDAAFTIVATAFVATFKILLDMCGILGTEYRKLSDFHPAYERAREVFGTSIDLNEVQIGDEQGSNSPCLEITGKVQKLFTDTPRVYTVGYLIIRPAGAEWSTAILFHELTHVWQYEQYGYDYAVGSMKAQQDYNYGYDNEYDGSGAEEELNAAGGDFQEFNVEQQAQMIMHYYVRRYEVQPPLDCTAWQPYANIVHDP